MAEYARRLVAGDRAAIANLYAAEGAILIHNGRRMDVANADIARLYADASWQPPARFQWRDLHFEAVGAEAVAVLGGFVWYDVDGSTAVGTYHAVLRRENGRFAIRIEDETVADQSRQTPG